MPEAKPLAAKPDDFKRSVPRVLADTVPHFRSW